MHSVGPSASSWWIDRDRGLICSSMSLPHRAASTRGPTGGSPVSAGARCRPPPTQQRAVARVLFEQPAEEAWCPRGTCRSRRRARRCARRRPRGARRPVDDVQAVRQRTDNIPGNATSPRSLSCASAFTDAHSAASPSRKSSGPKSSSPVAARASASSASGWSSVTGRVRRRRCDRSSCAGRGRRALPRPVPCRSRGRSRAGSCPRSPARTAPRAPRARPPAGTC